VKYWLLALPLMAVTPALAGEAGPVEKHLTPVKPGYAAANPDILLRQRIFGLAHGVHLLLSGCLDKDVNAEVVQQAYDAWHAVQHAAIEGVRVMLAEHHFGASATEAHWQDIAKTLGLKETIYPSLGTVSLQEACATLPQALTQPRYDFATQLEMNDESVQQ
jgi:hypothetical protein